MNHDKEVTECQLYLYAHLLAGKPDLDLPWDPDLQQEKNKAQQSSRWHAHTMKVSLTSNSNFTLHSITNQRGMLRSGTASFPQDISEESSLSYSTLHLSGDNSTSTRSSPAKLGCHFYRTEGFVPGSPTAPPHPASFSPREG